MWSSILAWWDPLVLHSCHMTIARYWQGVEVDVKLDIDLEVVSPIPNTLLGIKQGYSF